MPARTPAGPSPAGASPARRCAARRQACKGEARAARHSAAFTAPAPVACCDLGTLPFRPPAWPRRSCRKTVQQLLAAFRRLGSVLRPVLAPGVLVQVSGELIQAVCSQIMGACVRDGGAVPAAARGPANHASALSNACCQACVARACASLLGGLRPHPRSIPPYLLGTTLRGCVRCSIRIHLTHAASTSAAPPPTLHRPLLPPFITQRTSWRFQTFPWTSLSRFRRCGRRRAGVCLPGHTGHARSGRVQDAPPAGPQELRIQLRIQPPRSAASSSASAGAAALLPCHRQQ